MGFQLVPKQVNDVMAIILRYSTDFDSIGGQLHKSG